MSRPRTGIEQSQEVIDFRRHGQRASRWHRRDSLIHTDRRRETGNVIDIGARKLPEERSRLDGNAFQISPLAFCKQSVERQRTLAGTAHPGHHNQLTGR